MFNYSIGKRLVENYLYQPYSWFLNRNSAELGKTILSEVSTVVSGGIRPLIDVISKGIITITIITLLIIVDPKLTSIVCILLGGIYGIIFYFIRNFLQKMGQERLKSNQSRYIAVSEAFGASKEVKVGGLEETFIKQFSQSAKTFARTQASVSVLGQLPRFFLEAIIFGGMLVIILSTMDQSDSFISILPIISLYAFAGYRLMPALQHMYASFTLLTFVTPALDKLYIDIKKLKPFNKNQKEEVLSFNKFIKLKNVCYSYPNSSRTTLKDISLNIPARTTIGIIGSTGSGKTTAVDIILGLLEPMMGTLEVDEKVITKQNIRSWQRSIGYVPQNIYLADDSIKANIAFGVDPKDIDQFKVEKASKIANLHEFVIEELPKQYETITGERGVRLSGGQRQRVGIARALYHNPKILILDEATSALDIQTEKAVMDAVNNLGNEITIILIAHRLSTVKKCNKIFLLDKGKLKNEGTFDELINLNEDFKKSANNS
jgi:ABC-type bacteriocin/lantibiotic exporter with double-glycine peptidase domain